MIINLNSLQNIQDIKCDLCIVGGGPAGAILFEKLSETKKDIVLLESGSVDIEEKYQTLNEGKILLNGKNRNADHEVDLNNALSIWRLRGLGGTTNHWTGSCTKFTDMDFLKRDWINLSGWPLSKTELDQYYEQAKSYVEISTSIFDDRVWGEIGLDPNILNLNYKKIRTIFYRNSGFIKNKISYPVNFKKYLFNKKNKNIKDKIIYNATLTKLISNDENNHIKFGIVKSFQGLEKKIIAKRFILCCGGYENARILLNSGKKNGLGNNNDFVGRCHLAKIESRNLMQLLCNSKEIATKLVYNFADNIVSNNFCKPTISFSNTFQKKNLLLNAGIYIDGSIDQNSATFKAMNIRKKIINKDFSNINLSTKELFFLIKNIDEILINLKKQYTSPRGVEKPMLPNVKITYISEQEPNKDSRIYLSKTKDRLGVYKLIFDWRLGNKDKENIKHVAKHLASVFGESKIGKIVINENLDDIIKNYELFSDLIWPCGTTRMSEHNLHGVVDKNLKSHFVNNLYICSSSTFPTNSYVPPTYTISALALRLSEHLKNHDIM